MFYYVKQGTAQVVGDKLQLAKIPPRSKFPIEVTIVAWQYGKEKELQSAASKERCFKIFK